MMHRSGSEPNIKIVDASGARSSGSDDRPTKPVRLQRGVRGELLHSVFVSLLDRDAHGRAVKVRPETAVRAGKIQIQDEAIHKIEPIARANGARRDIPVPCQRGMRAELLKRAFQAHRKQPDIGISPDEPPLRVASNPPDPIRSSRSRSEEPSIPKKVCEAMPRPAAFRHHRGVRGSLLWAVLQNLASRKTGQESENHVQHVRMGREDVDIHFGSSSTFSIEIPALEIVCDAKIRNVMDVSWSGLNGIDNSDWKDRFCMIDNENNLHIYDSIEAIRSSIVIPLVMLSMATIDNQIPILELRLHEWELQTGGKYSSNEVVNESAALSFLPVVEHSKDIGRLYLHAKTLEMYMSWQKALQLAIDEDKSNDKILERSGSPRALECERGDSAILMEHILPLNVDLNDL
uniref:PH domain-containing protein n=1 Tax=Guillardia theta TaxID=55529 RepID=A0A6U6B806_GUITH|mmetsp:Transcript_35289/g.110279  ORF Transcript_35289/g.110279 Transcript_35289/m.110279 type:complete len:404 (+) Transcript_35289:140-1351(+)